MAKTQQTETEQTQEENAETQQTQAQNAEFAEASDAGAGTDRENLDILLDINMPITVNLGKTEVPFRRLLQLGPGSVLQLDKEIGQPADIYVQDINFATGDIVVVDGCFAVRIKEILGADQPEPVAETAEQK